MDLRPGIFLCWLGLLVGLAGCDRKEGRDQADDILLAEVYDRKLYLEEVRNMIHEDMDHADSVRVLQAYVARWVRDQLLLAKAEENVPRDINLEKLVQDYRSSLVLNLYERRLMETQLDSAVSEQELLSWYEANKEQYLLEKPIVLIQFVRLRADSPNLQQALSWWNNPTKDHLGKLEHYANRHGGVALLQDSLWKGQDEIIQLVSPAVINENSLRPGKEVRYDDGDFHYLLKVLDTRSTLEVAPMAYIRDQATRAIMLQRQIALIDSVKEKLFEMELRKNNVRIHTR